MPKPSDHDTPRRTVHVIDRSGWGTSGAYPAIRALTLIWACPTCQGPRGIPQKHRFHEDGEWFTCDRWDNPCGPVDMYVSVLNESRKG